MKSNWSIFLNFSDMLLSRRIGQCHDGQMARSGGKGTCDNKFAWPGKERILKFEIKGFLMIFVCVSSYAGISKSSNFKWFESIGNDGKYWRRDRGG